MNEFKIGGWTVVTDHSSIDDAQVSGEWMKARNSGVVEVKA